MLLFSVMSMNRTLKQSRPQFLIYKMENIIIKNISLGIVVTVIKY